MRTLNFDECMVISGGNDPQAPLGSPTAGSYFVNCMNYTSSQMSGTLAAGLTLASLSPGVFGTVATMLGASFAASSVAACSLGMIQYAQ